jgi:phosphoglycerate dehydrogenase-like enzyme
MPQTLRESPVTRLLIHEKSYRRLQAALDGMRGLELLLMADDGSISFNGQAISSEDAAPEAAWANADTFFSPGAGREFMVTLLQAPAVKWTQSGAAGFDHPIFGQLVGKGVRLTTSHGQAVGMAEYVVAGVLDHFQRGPERRAAQRRSAWERFAFREVMGSHWLLIGFGAIGQAVAQRARGFGARITGVRRSQEAHALADRIASPADLPELLPQADVVVLATPLSTTTRGLVDGEFLAAMKEGSVLVNVGRGGLVDEAALLTALDAGRPAHAVLDVFETEPLPADSPFWTHPRVAMTAHASAITAGMNSRNDAMFLDNLARFLAGRELLNEAASRDVLGE